MYRKQQKMYLFTNVATRLSPLLFRGDFLRGRQTVADLLPALIFT